MSGKSNEAFDGPTRFDVDDNLKKVGNNNVAENERRENSVFLTLSVFM